MKNNDYQNWSKAELIREIKRLKKRKKYGLAWEDKHENVVELCKDKLPVVKEIKSKEIITDKSKPVNLLIEGDNYHALSVLNYTHNKAIDVIYIDPPYNTGSKDFIFNDHYVDKEDAYRHSKWLSFMEKRLKLARNLLKPVGAIFISIDERELAQLKLLCDELFVREDNKLAIISVVNNWKGRSDDRHFATANEFLLIYSRDESRVNIFGFELDKEKLKEYSFKDEFGLYKPIPLKKTGKGWRRKDRPNMFYPIYYNSRTNKISLEKNRGFIEILPKRGGEDGRWRWGKETFLKLMNTEIVIKQTRNGSYNVYTKMRLSGENGTRTLKPKTVWIDPRYDTSKGADLLKSVLHKDLGDFNPKPLEYIKDILKISAEKNSIILDFMAGSGTTGHAVLELNKEDGGTRQFILCTNNENNICSDFCYPRMKNVIKGYRNLKDKRVKGLDGNLKYFKTDFVDAEPTDKNKKKLTEQATEMLCIKEGTFEQVLNRKHFKIFKNSDHYTGIIFDQLAIPEFKKAIKDIKGKFSVYVFSLSDETFDEEFADVKQKIKLSPIPEAILRVYRRIFR